MYERCGACEIRQQAAENAVDSETRTLLGSSQGRCDRSPRVMHSGCGSLGGLLLLLLLLLLPTVRREGGGGWFVLPQPCELLRRGLSTSGTVLWNR